MIQDCPSRIIRFGFTRRCDYRAAGVQVTPQGSRFVLHAPGGKAEVHMKLVGQHNVENALAAAALVGEVCGLTVNQIAAGLGDAPVAPGRLQPVDVGQPFGVLVDYAHTDDALVNVLKATRPLCKGRLHVVFGCGGDRDATKRPRMAKAAEEYGDVIYVTSDNPRTENAGAIIDQICAGFSRDTEKPIVIQPDRRLAIRQAIGSAEAGDIVLIAGKGHENYQIIQTTKHHFDDVEEAKRAIEGQMAAA
jgi:UDP-N-acetylmuramoyl-L-alanyl-D-glutamate--2,6-diaminopimelate ligase